MAHAPHLGLASVEFFVQGIRCIRVYYRSSDDTTIRESCYQQDIGWFVRGDGIVTRKAKKNSPLTALRCLAPLKLEAPWVETLLFTFKPGPLNILPESHQIHSAFHATVHGNIQTRIIMC
ncbi:hypothetical protein M7I_3162 [Glarea lozoyensis 74030]|uniref:Uncharacterized protein n=1 Tax=Glarea lozoyensis (strain ATCC 74030 / MF5533) TaxID=1104152 RepID=H0EKT1_GLAL7|nr:hypothetical protein M7I_3162 [Glarea lozoyensis 74030]